MGATHMRPYRAAGGNAFIAAMLDFLLLDSVCERFAHGLDGRLGKVAVASGSVRAILALSSFSPGWTDPHEIGLAAEIQQYGQGEAGELVATHCFSLASQGAMTLRFDRGRIEALRQATVVEMKDANRDSPLSRFREFGNAQFECARMFFSGQQVVNRRNIGWVALGCGITNTG